MIDSNVDNSYVKRSLAFLYPTHRRYLGPAGFCWPYVNPEIPLEYLVWSPKRIAESILEYVYSNDRKKNPPLSARERT
jgi:hypothetical protein